MKLEGRNLEEADRQFKAVKGRMTALGAVIASIIESLGSVTAKISQSRSPKPDPGPGPKPDLGPKGILDSLKDGL